MALVVLLRGVNVGGHRTFRPSVLARELSHLDAVSVGAAGTFVIRRPVSRAYARAEFARKLPFAAEIIICRGNEIVRLMTCDFFAGHPARPDIVRFVSVLARLPRAAPPAPMDLPVTGKWLVRVLARDRRFVVGVSRRQRRPSAAWARWIASSGLQSRRAAGAPWPRSPKCWVRGRAGAVAASSLAATRSAASAAGRRARCSRPSRPGSGANAPVAQGHRLADAVEHHRLRISLVTASKRDRADSDCRSSRS